MKKLKNKQPLGRNKKIAIAALMLVAIALYLLKFIGIKSIRSKYCANQNYWCGIGVDSSSIVPRNIFYNAPLGLLLEYFPAILIAYSVYLLLENKVKRRALRLTLCVFIGLIILFGEFIVEFTQLFAPCGFMPGGF